MSNNELTLILDQPSQLPAHLQGIGIGVSQQLMAAIGDVRNRIGMKGNRFRQILQGKEMGVFDENYLDIILVGVVPTVSRIFYEGAYSATGKNKGPSCYSVDSNDGPPPDVKHPQSVKCADCPQNVKGSKIAENGMATKACGYFRRIAFFLAGDTEGVMYYADVKAMGLFGDSNKSLNKFNMNDYAKVLQSRGIDASVLVTRLSFDTDSSVPKLYFQPLRYISPEEAAVVMRLAEGEEIKAYLEINMNTVDISAEQAADEAPAEEVAQPAAPAPQAAPKPQQAPQQAAPAPQQAQAPKPQAPAQAAPARPQQAPAQRTTTVQVDSGVQAPAQQAAKPQSVQQPAQARPQAPAQQAAPKPVVTQPAPVVQEVTSDAELNDILAELGM